MLNLWPKINQTNQSISFTPKRAAASVLVVIAILFMGGIQVNRLTFRAQNETKTAQPQIEGIPSLDDSGETFYKATESLSATNECLPIYIRSIDRADVFYLYCSKQARAEEARERNISGEFHVDTFLARRFHFWRRIYSLWNSDQYVLHSSVYPEVVFAIVDVSQSNITDKEARKKLAYRITNQLRRDFRKLLAKMHRNRKLSTDRFSPSMKRIATLMAHIDDDRKYLNAAYSLRRQRGQHDYIAKGLAIANQYMPFIEEEFRKQGLPLELARIAFIESSFNIRAYSKAGAAGVYQLMPETARQYMTVNDVIDERRDPIKSARAAAKLLLMNYRILGRWPLAITAYNHGVGGMERAVNSVGSNDIIDIIKNYRSDTFGFASSNFYTGFLGLLATLQHQDRIFPEVRPLQPLSFQVVKLEKAMKIRAIMQTYGMDSAMLRELNPDISRGLAHSPNAFLPKRYELKTPMPADSSDTSLVASE